METPKPNELWLVEDEVGTQSAKWYWLNMWYPKMGVDGVPEGKPVKANYLRLVTRLMGGDK